MNAAMTGTSMTGLLSVRQVAERLGVSDDTVRRHPSLPQVRVSPRRIMIPRESVESILRGSPSTREL